MSSQGGKVAKEGDIELVQDQLKNEFGNTFLAYYHMRKPANLPNSVLVLNNEFPKVCLDLVQPSDLPRLSAMQDVNHRNIMRIEAVKKVEIRDQDLLALFLDYHNGPLGVHLDSLQLYDNYGVIPSQGLRDIIRQIIWALEELRRNGLYHGALSMSNIFFSKNGKLLIKLFNFQSKVMPKENAQLEDCVALGLLLEEISSELKLTKPALIYSAIDYLASTLTGLDIASLQTVKEIALKQTFFWELRRRIIFWIHDVPKALENQLSVQAIKAHTWKLPWTSHTHQGLLQEMNAYRIQEEERKRAEVGNFTPLTKEEKKSVSYKENEPLHYVKCISGAYTHEDTLKGKLFDNFGYRITVDAAVQMTDPELLIVLYKLLKDAGTIQD